MDSEIGASTISELVHASPHYRATARIDCMTSEVKVQQHSSEEETVCPADCPLQYVVV